MRIALVISSLGAGGAERVMSELANYWAQKHEVFLVTLSGVENVPFYHLDQRIQLIRLDQVHSSSSILKRGVSVIKRFLALRSTLKGLNPRVCLSFVDAVNLLTLVASAWLKFPIIVAERTHPAYHVLPWLHRNLRHSLYRRAARVVVQTPSVRQYFHALMHVSVIPNAVATQVRRVQNNKVRHIVSSGRLCVSKGFADLIQAFAAFNRTYPDTILTIYGEGSDRSRLEKLIDLLLLQGKVFLPGEVSDVVAKIAEADLFVFPSYYEGFPNALCEAMAVGLPVMASNCSGSVDIVRDGIDGRLFPVGDVSMLESLMLELAEDQDQRVRLGEEARRISDRFNPSRVWGLWDELIETEGGC